MTQSAANSPRRGLLVGAGYFSDFQLDAWQRLPGATIDCVCDLDREKVRRVADKYEIANVCSSIDEALQCDGIDFVDLATPPTDRLTLVRKVIDRKLPLICQKPLANDHATAMQIIADGKASSAPFMVHENFRFQPWYREIKQLLTDGVVGSTLHSITMRTRLGDGWGNDAYLDRQPYFRTMTRLLVHETGVHFVDTFRYLAETSCGAIVECSANLRRLNGVIEGEDAGHVCMRFENGAEARWDANRYNEPLTDNPRFTFGELQVEADGGSIWLALDGTIQVKPLGKPATRHPYEPSTLGFAGDCVYACQQHFLDVLDGKASCETSPSEYQKSLRVVEAAYQSSHDNRPVSITGVSASSEASSRRVIDLSLPVSNEMRAVNITPAKILERDGWNATTLSLYSHAGTHMDAPKHFLPDGSALDQTDLSVCIGKAIVVDVSPVQPRQLLTIKDVKDRLPVVEPNARLLFRTDWYQRFGTEAYRDELPRISIELAGWLVEQQVAMIGVEPPSVADVNNIAELTDVHQTLFRGNVVIIEGLANLDQLSQSEVEFIALPLKIIGGDGCPVRAIAIEETGSLR